jgi:hypothetical protein
VALSASPTDRNEGSAQCQQYPNSRSLRGGDRRLKIAGAARLGTDAAHQRNTACQHRYGSTHRAPSRARRLPAYGRYLLTLRERGRVPAGVVLVSAGLWLQEQVPPGHLLVVPDDALVARIDFSVLAGLDACIVHDDHGVARACDLVNPILAVRPTWQETPTPVPLHHPTRHCQ